MIINYKIQIKWKINLMREYFVHFIVTLKIFMF